MKLKYLSLLVLLGLIGFGSACRKHAAAIEDKPGKIKVGIVFDIGGKNDRSFNAAAWEGVKRAKNDLDITLRDVEPGNPMSIEPAMRAFAEQNFDLIIGVGFAQGPIMQRVAKDFPNIKFAIIDGVIFEDDGKTPMKNVASLVFREHEGSYLVGMIAALKSKTGVLGFLGGMDIPLIHRFETGYKEGAQSINPNIKVIDNYVGVTDGAWNNPGKGKELAMAQIGKGDLDVGYYVDATPAESLSFPTLSERHIEDGKYQLAPLMTYDYRILAPAEWSEKVMGKDWPDLIGLPWLATPPHSAHRRLLDDIFRPLGSLPKRVAFTDQEEAMIDFVESGICLSLARDAIIDRITRKRNFVIADKVTLTCDLSFACLSSRRHEPVISHAFSAMRTVWDLEPANAAPAPVAAPRSRKTARI